MAGGIGSAHCAPENWRRSALPSECCLRAGARYSTLCHDLQTVSLGPRRSLVVGTRLRAVHTPAPGRSAAETWSRLRAVLTTGAQLAGAICMREYKWLDSYHLMICTTYTLNCYQLMHISDCAIWGATTCRAGDGVLIWRATEPQVLPHLRSTAEERSAAGPDPGRGAAHPMSLFNAEGGASPLSRVLPRTSPQRSDALVRPCQRLQCPAFRTSTRFPALAMAQPCCAAAS